MAFWFGARDRAGRWLVGLVALAWAPGCGAAGYAVEVGWAFADGRACAEAGAETVRLVYPLAGSGRERSVLFRCTAGEGGRRVPAPDVPAGALLTAEALSPGGGSLYRGAALVEDAEPPGALDVVLVYGARTE